MNDLGLTIRRTYKALRVHGSPFVKGQAWLLMKRDRGPRRFIAGPKGTVCTDDRVALLAELRLLALNHFPATYVANFDR
jgi:hypothetical protein